MHPQSSDKGPRDIGKGMGMVLNSKKPNFRGNSGCSFVFGSKNPADTDVLRTSLGRLKEVTTFCDQTRRRQDVLQKTSDLRRLEDVRLT